MAMSKKKITTKTKTVSKKKKVEVDKFEFTLTAAERLELLYLDARIKNAELSIRLNKKELQEQVTNLHNHYTKVLEALENDKTISKTELQQIKQAVEDKYEIKLEDYGFVEETGKLTKLPN